MNDETSRGSTADLRDLLLEEYRNLSDSFWKNEQSGETRVNLFIGLVTAGIGAIVTLGTSEHGHLEENTLRMVITAALSVLIVLGVVTLFRMLNRNETTDGYKRGCDAVRQVFKDHFGGSQVLLHYYPFAGSKRNNSKRISIRKLGGLTHTVAVVNSVLMAGLAGSLAYPQTTPIVPLTPRVVSLVPTYAWSAGVFCLALLLQFMYVDYREQRAKSQPRERETSHAGGVVYRFQSDLIKYLIVGPKEDEPGKWLLPKGHVEVGEGHGEAALREVREETGVVAQVVCFLGRDEFDVPASQRRPAQSVRKGKRDIAETERVRAKYYLMEMLYEVDRSESRRLAWFTFTEAYNLLSHPSNKYLLQLAEKERVERDRRRMAATV